MWTEKIVRENIPKGARTLARTLENTLAGSATLKFVSKTGLLDEMSRKMSRIEDFNFPVLLLLYLKVWEAHIFLRKFCLVNSRKQFSRTFKTHVLQI